MKIFGTIALHATLAMLVSVSAASADSHAQFGNASQTWFQGEPGPAESRDIMWAVLPSFTPIAVPPRSVIVVEAPAADVRAREQSVRTAPTRTPVEEVEEHVRGGLAVVSYLVSR